MTTIKKTKQNKTTMERLMNLTQEEMLALNRNTITASAMSSGGIGTTHYQNTTNDNRKHKR